MSSEGPKYISWNPESAERVPAVKTTESVKREENVKEDWRENFQNLQAVAQKVYRQNEDLKGENKELSREK